MSPRLYDAHLHLQLPPLKEQADSIIEELKRRNVHKIVVNGTREEDWQAVADMAEAYEMVIPAFGLHPWHAHNATPEWKNKLCSFLDRHPYCVGEIGLDKWVENPDLEKQVEAFTFQLHEARNRKVPAVVHCLKAWGLLLETLQKEGPFPDGLLIHSYGGSVEMIKPLSKQGAYFSLSGYFAHPRKEKQRDVFKQIPLDRLLLETDAPDMLPPEQLRVLDKGAEWNHPANISAIYSFAAELFELSSEETARQMENNFNGLFKRG